MYHLSTTESSSPSSTTRVSSTVMMTIMIIQEDSKLLLGFPFTGHGNTVESLCVTEVTEDALLTEESTGHTTSHLIIHKSNLKIQDTNCTVTPVKSTPIYSE
jgi:hypothetical protein